MDTKKMCTYRRKHPLILIEDETVHDMYVKRYIECVEKDPSRNIKELAEKLVGNFSINMSSKQRVVRDIACGWNLYVKYVVSIAKAYNINVRHFLDFNDADYNNHPYEEYDEIAAFERNLRYAFTYGNYTESYLKRIKVVSHGEYNSPIAVYFKKKRADEDNTYFFDMDWVLNYLTINHVIRAEKLLNIPIPILFTSNEDEFHAYVKAHIRPKSYYEEKYNTCKKGCGRSKEGFDRRYAKLIEMNPEAAKRPRSRQQFIYDPVIRQTIINKVKFILDEHDITTQADLGRAIGVSARIARALMNGYNTHIDHYFKFCDRFGVFFGELIDPKCTKLHKYRGKNSDIDIRVLLMNECSKKYSDIDTLEKSNVYEKFKLKRDINYLYNTIVRSTSKSEHDENSTYNVTETDTRLLFNTLLDYCDILKTDIVSLINSTNVGRKKSSSRHRYYNPPKLIASDHNGDLNLICETYNHLTDNQKEAVMTIFRYLHDKTMKQTDTE